MERWIVTSNRAVASLCLALIVALAQACSPRGPLERFVERKASYDEYRASLEQAALDRTALGRDWIQAGDASLRRPLAATLPFRETGQFLAAEPTAVAYRMALSRGRRLLVEVTFDTKDGGRLFADLFEVSGDGTSSRVAHDEPATSTLTYDIERTGEYVLRLQPELLRGGRFTLVQRTLASLSFPVSGFTARAVHSTFGAARDGGARTHHGVDIFAPKGTPVVAAADGWAMASTNGLGGNVVWQRAAGGHTLYYAHLDRWAISTAASVRKGDVLGYVGNTGNARSTRPHLHFGIYADGPVDPLPFLRPDDVAPAAPRASLDRLGTFVRLTRASALREGAHVQAATVARVERASVGRVVGISRSSFRLAIPDSPAGYVAQAATAPTIDGAPIPGQAR